MMLKKPKKKPGGGARRQKQNPQQEQRRGHEESDEEHAEDDEVDAATGSQRRSIPEPSKPEVRAPDEDEGPILPLARYNTMLAVLRNTLYLYSGILERGSREITLDDFWSLALDKMDVYTCLKPLTVDVEAGGDESSSDDEDGDDGDEDDMDSDESGGSADGDDDKDVPAAPVPAEVEELEEEQPEEENELRVRATDFLNAANQITAAEAIGTPLPGETLAAFYERTREYWVQQAFATSGNRGKELRRDGFALAEERYNVYKPILQEVEKILEEAGLDADEMKKVAGGAGSSAAGTSRNRR